MWRRREDGRCRSCASSFSRWWFASRSIPRVTTAAELGAGQLSRGSQADHETPGGVSLSTGGRSRDSPMWRGDWSGGSAAVIRPSSRSSSRASEPLMGAPAKWPMTRSTARAPGWRVGCRRRGAGARSVGRSRRLRCPRRHPASRSTTVGTPTSPARPVPPERPVLLGCGRGGAGGGAGRFGGVRGRRAEAGGAGRAVRRVQTAAAGSVVRRATAIGSSRSHSRSWVVTSGDRQYSVWATSCSVASPPPGRRRRRRRARTSGTRGRSPRPSGPCPRPNRRTACRCGRCRRVGSPSRRGGSGWNTRRPSTLRSWRYGRLSPGGAGRIAVMPGARGTRHRAPA